MGCDGEECKIKNQCSRYMLDELKVNPFMPTLCQNLDYDFIPLEEIELEAVQ